MGLRSHAEEMLRVIINDEVTAMGWPLLLSDPSGFFATLTGRSQDIAQIIDPDTGQIVSGRMASAVFNINDLTDAGFSTLPVGIADTAQKPWTVAFNDINGSAHIFKVVESNPDRTLGEVVLLLEWYKAAPAAPACVPTHLDDTFWQNDQGFVWVPEQSRWNADPGAASYGILQVIGSWADAYRPTKAWVTLVADRLTPADLPVATDVWFRAGSEVSYWNLGSTEVIVTSPAEVLLVEVDLDWSGIPPAIEMYRLHLSSDSYAREPDITCIGFTDD